MSNNQKLLISIKNDLQDIKTDVSVLKTDVSVLKTDVSVLKTEVFTLKKDFHEFVKRDADIQEYEITETLFKYLNKIDYSVKIKPLNFIKIIKNIETGEQLTDLDGVIISTIDKDLIRKYSSKNNQIINNNRALHQYKRQLSENTTKIISLNKIYIIEAKRFINREKIEKKIVQYQKLKELLELIHSDIGKTNPYLIKLNQHHKLDRFKKENIYLVLGASIWENGCKSFIPKDNNIKTISLSGNRYEVNNNIKEGVSL